ncbi:hypothetical protein Anapl_11990 [Anas platyrhynchos]|uniref:Uncharacterized protein n=1 Tax=Anas platyrhynchos TaxID=8839 RepID=R0LRZ0_ANAPL|nr:hypothetical protein Anapl_11990 [Anas platyrhynchos]
MSRIARLHGYPDLSESCSSLQADGHRRACWLQVNGSNVSAAAEESNVSSDTEAAYSQHAACQPAGRMQTGHLTTRARFSASRSAGQAVLRVHAGCQHTQVKAPARQHSSDCEPCSGDQAAFPESQQRNVDRTFGNTQTEKLGMTHMEQNGQESFSCLKWPRNSAGEQLESLEDLHSNYETNDIFESIGYEMEGWNTYVLPRSLDHGAELTA